MALERLREHPDLTLLNSSCHDRRKLNVILPNLFKHSCSESSPEFFTEVLSILLGHLK